MSELEPTRTYSNHTATEVLRRLLDELGVEWGASDTYRLLVTSWNDVSGHSWAFMEHRDGSFSKLTAYHLTPAQAIVATLGSCNAGRYVGLRQGEYWERTENSNYYCGGCGWKVTDHDSYCPECGGALHNATLGSCNCPDNCTNSERTETCEADETDTWECVRDDLGGYGKTMTVHVMECTECGHVYEHVNGDYEYCPRCGRKRRDVEE